MGVTLGADRGGAARPAPLMNVTPLVDVALVILIIFMAVAPMLTKTFTLDVPPEPEDLTAPPPASDEAVVLTLDASGTMKLNKRVVSHEQLAELLPGMLAANRHKVMHFDAADGLPYGQVVAALDACRHAGARNIAVVTKKLEAR